MRTTPKREQRDQRHIGLRRAFVIPGVGGIEQTGELIAVRRKSRRLN
jgi:hypothetical protein